MKKTNYAIIVSVFLVVAFIGGQIVERTYWKSKTEAMSAKIQEYRGYYVTAEHLLDILEREYHWIDGVDHDGYYESRECAYYLDSIGIENERAHYMIVIENNKKWIEENK